MSKNLPDHALAPGLAAAEDGLVRCAWCMATPQYQHYHDHEWGAPVHDERRLFEKICLEGFQAGLSWLTILNKREHFRAAFAHFDAQQVAAFGEADVARLLADAGIVRHRGKIEAVINNAQRLPDLVREHGSFAAYLWQFAPPGSTRPAQVTLDVVRQMGVPPEAVALSKDLKKRGWKFVGPTTMYALMQAMGMVNDHLEGCHVRGAAAPSSRASSENRCSDT